MQALILLTLKISIMLCVFALGLKATFADMTYLFHHPRHLLRAFFSINIVMPALALFLAMTFNLNPAVKIALVALSVSPVPPLFPRKAQKAGCAGDYSVGLLVATAALSIVVIPIALEIFERITGVPLSMHPSSIAVLVLTTILVPLLLGITLRAAAPSLGDRLAKPLSISAFMLLILAAIPVLIGSVRTMLSLVGDGTLLTFLAFALVGLIVGHFLGGPEPEGRRALGLATAIRHPAIAAAIAHTNFPAQKLAIPAIILYLIVSGLVTGLASRRSPTGRAPIEIATRKAA